MCYVVFWDLNCLEVTFAPILMTQKRLLHTDMKTNHNTSQEDGPGLQETLLLEIMDSQLYQKWKSTQTIPTISLSL